MATHPAPQSVASAIPQGVPQNRNALTPGRDRAAGPPIAEAGTGLVAGSAARHSGTTPDGEFRTVAESADQESNGDSSLLRLTPALERMPVGLTVAIPVRDFRVRNLLAMRTGELIETQWANGEDLPLSSGGLQLAWSEFEVVDTRLAVRVTRLA